MSQEFTNNDKVLLEKADRVAGDRKKAGLEGLVGGLEYVIINTEKDMLRNTVAELLRYTGLTLDRCFSTDEKEVCVLSVADSADFLVTARKTGDNPFQEVNVHPRSESLPNTRFETFVFNVDDLQRYVALHKEQGRAFLTEDVIDRETHMYIQTCPSPFTGNSLGFVQWKNGRREHGEEGIEDLEWNLTKPDLDHLRNIGRLDHCATRVKAEHRDEAIIEFMQYTDYHFDFAIFVKSMNSITNVARLTRDDFAMVFTSGITPFASLEESGPTEKFIYNYGPRVHHMAFHTEEIDQTFQGLKGDGMEFLVELVGSPEEGLKQTFTVPSKNTLLVNEYIHRFGDFDGFFTRSNVTMLTAATDRQ